MHVSRWHLGLTLGNLVFLSEKEDRKIQLPRNNSYWNKTKQFFCVWYRIFLYKVLLPSSCPAFEVCQGPAEWEGCALCACPAPPGCRWCSAEVTHAVTSLLDGVAMTVLGALSPGSWTTGTCNGAESLCQSTAGSPTHLFSCHFVTRLENLLLMLFIHYEVWCFLLFLSGKQRVCL